MSINANKHKNILCVLSRCPVHNPCKTRIARDTSKDFAEKFSICCLKDLITNIYSDEYEIIIATDTNEDVNWFRTELNIKAFPINLNNLEKNHQNLTYSTFTNLFEMGYEKIISLDMDIPYIKSLTFVNVFKKLKEIPLIIGPGLVGGFTFIAMCKGTLSMSLFENVGWGTTSTDDIINNSKNKSIKWSEAYDDLDDISSIKRNYHLIKKYCPNLLYFIDKNLLTYGIHIKLINYIIY